MSFCTKCGAQLAPGARFCPKCGTPAEHAETAHDAATPQAPTIPPPVIAQPAPPPPAPPQRPATPPPRATSPAATPTPAATATTAPSSYRTPAAGSMAHTPVQPAKRSTWWIVPLVIVGLVVLAWLLLAGLPFGGRDEAATGDAPATETIAEGTTTAQNEPITGTVIEVPGAGEPMTTDTTAQVQTTTLGGTMPGGVGAPPAGGTPPAAGTAPMQGTPPPGSDEQPRVVEERPVQRTPVTSTPAPARTPVRATPTPQPARRNTPAPQPPVRRVVPPPSSPPPQQASQTPSGEISDAQAAATLRGFISSSNYYDGVSGDCVQVRSHGYRNVGYTFSVWDGCMAGGGSRMLGRWRVDSKTREVFRQREDGRFLRP